MSAKCQWCRRKRPEVAVKVDGREINVCSNCKTIIEKQFDEGGELKKDRRIRHPVTE